MRPPVAGVADEGQLLPALAALDEEGAAPDRPTRLRVVDPVAPDLLEVLASKRVLRENDVEEGFSPGEEARAEDDANGLRIDGNHAADPGLVGIVLVAGYFSLARYVNTKSRAVIGTPSLQRASGRMWYVSVNGGFVVKSTPETSLGRRTKSGPSVERAVEDGADGEAALLARADEDVETGRLGADDDHGAAALRRLRAHAARSRDREERDGDRRC